MRCGVLHVQGYEESVQKWKDQWETVLSEKNKVAAEMAALCNDIGSQNLSKKKEIDSLTSQLTQEKEAADKLKTQVQDLLTQQTTLQASVSNLQSGSEGNQQVVDMQTKQELSGLQQQLASLQQELAQEKEKCSSLKQQFDDQVAFNTDVQLEKMDAVGKKDQEKTAGEVDIGIGRRYHMTADCVCAEMEKEKAAMADKVSALEKSLEELSKQNDSMKSLNEDQRMPDQRATDLECSGQLS